MARARILMAFYAAMALGALVATGWHNVRYFLGSGDTDLLGYVDAALVNSASTALTLDVLLVGVVCQVFMVVEGRRVGLPWTWLVGLLVGTATVAVAVTFPLFLILRSQARREAEEGGQSRPGGGVDHRHTRSDLSSTT